MMQLNLLPYREAKNKEKANLFFISVLVFLVASAGAWYGVYSLYSNRLEDSTAKVAYLKSAETVLDKRIASINSLKKNKTILLKKEKLIENLQEDRNMPTRIFNELQTATPNGVYLFSTVQIGKTMTLSGYSQSNSRIAVFMRNLANGEVLYNPLLGAISMVKQDGHEVKSFSIAVRIRSYSAYKDSLEKKKGHK
jgi:type IV pilus assembly protein PilN